MALKSKAELILALLYSPDSTKANAPVVGITRLEKLLFLLKKETSLLNSDNPKDNFNFVPFRMGPWSQEVYDETDFLESLNLINKKSSSESSVEDGAHNNELFDSMILAKYQKTDFISQNNSVEKFELTEKGADLAQKIWNKLSAEEKKQILNIKKQFNKMNLRQFLRYVYKKYPEYASKSEIKEYLGVEDV